MALILLLPLAFAALFLAVESEGYRDRFLRAAVAFGVAAWALVELLSLPSAVTRWALAVAWLLVAVAAFLRRRPINLPRLKPDPVVVVCLAGCVTVAVFTGLLAVLPIASCGGCKSGSSVQVCAPNHNEQPRRERR